ncbi:MAG: TonB-dependent receptor [Gammaproteobacteria bacterium]|nr:TonB-dependent receptor [Gammaproteobacteria bacterium]
MKNQLVSLFAVICSASLLAAEKAPSAENAATDQDPTADNRLVVKSQWREQAPNKVAGSLQVIDQQDIEQRDAKHLEQLLNRIANINFNTGANRGRFVQIRGIGERSQFQDPINPSVAFYLDGIDLSGILGGATLYDIAQVEVLRGPQGARFGASALAGAIYATSEAATSERSRFDWTLAEYNTASVGVATGTQLNDSSALRLSLHHLSSDGFIQNEFLQRDDTNNRDELTARLKYQYQPSNDLTFDFAWHHLDIDNGYDAFSLDNDRNTRSDEPGFDRQFTDALSFSTRFSGLEKIAMEFHLAFAKSEIDYGYDEDWTYAGFHPDGYSSFDRYYRERQSSNLDWRWLSKAPQRLLGGNTDWVFGLYFKNEDEDLIRQYTYLADPFTSAYATSTQAIYGEFTTEYNPQWSTTFGVRVEQRELDYSDGGFIASDDATMVGGKLGVQYAIDERAMFYTLLARGFKAGGVNPQVQLAPALRTFDSEKNWNLELGYKRQLDNGHLRIALFNMKREDQHTKQWQIFTRPDNTQGFIGYVGNVDNGSNQGAEIEWQWRALPELHFDLALGFLDAKLDVINRDETTQVFDRDAAQAPAYTYSLTSRWLINSEFSSQLIFEGKDDYYFSDTHDERSTAVSLVHWRFTYQAQDWSLALFVHNLTDEDYYTRGFGGFGNDPRDGYTSKPYYQLGDPRQAGVTFNYTF